MSELERRRRQILEDLDIVLDRLDAADAGSWDRATPCTGWTVRNLAAHLTGTLPFLESRIAATTGAAVGDPLPEVEATASQDEIRTALRERSTVLGNRLANLTEDDYARPPGDTSSFLPPSVAMYVDLTAFETAIHRNDLEVALGDTDPVIAEVGIAAVDAILGQFYVQFAEMTGARPETPVTISIEGQAIGHTLAWDGANWSGEPTANGKQVRIQGNDSALTLFTCGRIPADHPSLTIDGDMDLARQFKTYVPGP